MGFLDLLRAELLTDPKGLGYAGQNATQAAAAMNAPGSGTAVDRTVIPSYEIVNATTASDWAALTAAEKQRYQTLTGAGFVDASNANVRAAFQAMFGAGTATRTALTAMLTQSRTRAEELFGHAVTAADITTARA